MSTKKVENADPKCKKGHAMWMVGVVVLDDDSVSWIEDPVAKKQIQEQWMSHQMWFCKGCAETTMLVSHPSDWAN